ncbi:MAG TPA: tetratricopeptide repeat protein [Thermoanaerobaculia bacterium]|jgi:tetratricopeptide (TPR) repeat protein
MKRTAVAVSLSLLVATVAAAQRAGTGGGAVGRVERPAGGFRPPGIFLKPERVALRPYVPTQIPFPPPAKQWVRIETPHFVLLSSAGERRTRGIAVDLERLASTLTRTSPDFTFASRRTTLFLFENRSVVQPYFDALRGARVDASGLSVRRTDGGTTIVIDAGERGGDILTPRHELVHDLLRRGQTTLPIWLDEGVAEYFSNAGQTIREHVSRLRGQLPIALPQLFALTSNDPAAASFDFYAESWAAVAALARRDPAAFYALLSDITDGRDAIAAIRQHFGMSPRELMNAMHKAAAPAAPLPFDTTTFEPTSQSLSREELLFALGELLGQVPARAGEAERHFKAALELAPGNGELELRYAEWLLAHGNAAAAREHAAKALALDAANESRTDAITGLAYLAERDHDAALPHLRRAYDAAPDRADLAFALFTIAIDRGDRTEADALFTKLVETPKATDARKVLMHTDIARADALAREGKLAEAARIVRELATKMPEHARTELERQAAALETAAARP